MEMNGLPPHIYKLREVFFRHGRSLYLVGGSVRDRLLGRPGQDIDLASDATPDEIKAMAPSLSPDSIYTIGERFGSIGLIFGQTKVEITTFRSEKYNPKSRHPQVRFGTTLEEDLSRRDFTINAIAQDLRTDQIIDLFGGLADLRSTLIRSVGQAVDRFGEDPLRLLRAVRLAAELSFSIESHTRAAIAECASAITQISWERIAEEMNKILLSTRPAWGLRQLTDLGLMKFIIPEIMEMRGMSQSKSHHKDVFEHTLAVVENIAPTLTLRWAALLHDVAKPRTISWEEGEVHFKGHEQMGADMCRRILTRLRMSRKIIETVSKMVRMHGRINLYSSDWTDGAVRRLLKEAWDDWEDMLALSRSDITSHKPARVEAALARLAELEKRCKELLAAEEEKALTSPLDGNEIMDLFSRPPGPWIGKVKSFLLELVIDGSLAPDDKAGATALARQFVEESGI